MNENKNRLSGLLAIAIVGVLLLIAGAACAPKEVEAQAGGSEPAPLEMAGDDAASAPEAETFAAETVDVALAAPAAQIDDGVAGDEEIEDGTESVAPPCGGPFGGRGPGPHYGEEAPGMALVDPEMMHTAIAGALGISVDALEEALASGTPLYALAEENGVDIESVRAAMQAVREAAIEQALADGTITDEQAEWLRSRPGPGGFGGMHGSQGPGRGMRGGRGYGPRQGGPGSGPFGGGNGWNSPSS